jgi:hypothetical protein
MGGWFEASLPTYSSALICVLALLAVSGKGCLPDTVY